MFESTLPFGAGQAADPARGTSGAGCALAPGTPCSVHAVARPRDLFPDERRRVIAQALRDRGGVSVAELTDRFGISPMTARRDLATLEREGVARRTHGGAVLPGRANEEDSFGTRLSLAVADKQRLASAAFDLIAPGDAVFLDSSTTAFGLARLIVSANRRSTVLTNAVPVMQLVCEHDAPDVHMIGIGGTIRRLTHSFVGPQAVRVIRDHFADKAVLSIRGLTHDGHMTDPDPLEAEVKRAMLEQARMPLLLVDGSKFDRPALSAIAHVTKVARVLAAGASPSAVASLASAGVAVDRF